jgi:hypothetical protein
MTVGPRALLSAAFRLHHVQSRESDLTQMSKWRIRVNRLAGRLGVTGVDALAIRFFGGFGMKNSSGGTGLARGERLQIMLSLAELNAVDNYRFQHRMPSRAAAVRELLRHGIGAVGAVMENTGVRSGDYGVLKAPKGLGPARKP